ncbi:unnamed protein product [marine sediment metagenome]|uniref:Uncharacterized protein n=1 Tax=marine sediment metagenome TaxID=412755 RepID=X1TYV3_9ZZZZ
MEVVAEFNECPDCLVDAWLMKSIVKKEIEKGNMGGNVVANTQTRIITNIDARKPPLIGARIPSARVFYDTCMKCGKEHIVRIEKGYVTLPRPGMPPIFI